MRVYALRDIRITIFKEFSESALVYKANYKAMQDLKARLSNIKNKKGSTFQIVHGKYCYLKQEVLLTSGTYYEVEIKLGKKYNGVKRRFNILINKKSLSLAKQLKNELVAMTKRARAAISPKKLIRQGIMFGEPVRFYQDNRVKIYSEKGQILKVYMYKKLEKLFEPKAPVTNDRHVGIELEFCAPLDRTSLAIRLLEINAQNFAQIKEDGSLRPQKKLKEHGYEIALLFRESTYKRDLKKITDLLKEVGAQTLGRRCGLHVHIDVRKRNRDRVYNNLVSCQSALLKLVDPFRVNSQFCTPVYSKKWPETFTKTREERYKTINAAAYHRFKTLEVRMHEGTVDFDQISNWVDLLVKIANYIPTLKRDVVTSKGLSVRFKLNHRLIRYVSDQYNYWLLNGPRDFEPANGGNAVPMFNADMLVQAAPIPDPREAIFQEDDGEDPF